MNIERWIAGRTPVWQRLDALLEQVEVTDATKTSYTVVGHSRSGTDFAVRRASDGSASRTCTRPGVAQCRAGGIW